MYVALMINRAGIFWKRYLHHYRKYLSLHWQNLGCRYASPWNYHPITKYEAPTDDEQPGSRVPEDDIYGTSRTCAIIENIHQPLWQRLSRRYASSYNYHSITQSEAQTDSKYQNTASIEPSGGYHSGTSRSHKFGWSIPGLRNVIRSDRLSVTEFCAYDIEFLRYYPYRTLYYTYSFLPRVLKPV